MAYDVFAGLESTPRPPQVAPAAGSATGSIGGPGPGPVPGGADQLLNMMQVLHAAPPPQMVGSMPGQPQMVGSMPGAGPNPSLVGSMPGQPVQGIHMPPPQGAPPQPWTGSWGGQPLPPAPAGPAGPIPTTLTPGGPIGRPMPMPMPVPRIPFGPTAPPLTGMPGYGPNPIQGILQQLLGGGGGGLKAKPAVDRFPGPAPKPKAPKK